MSHFPIPPLAFPQLMVACVGLTGVILAYMYFVIGWATNRMKDWEAAKGEPRLGRPALTCWLAGIGDIMGGLIGVHLFFALYLALCGGLNWISIPNMIAMLVPNFWLWKILISFLYLYFSNDGNIDPLTEKELSKATHWHRPLKWTMIPFIITGCGGIIECYRGNMYAGLTVELFELCASFSLGAYCSLRGDLLARACVDRPRSGTSPEQ